MTSREIRQQFLSFFEKKGHKIVPSAPIVRKNDPTLMFTNSGMAPFKDCFLGNMPPPSARVADTQKCLRVTGKHNDLEDVGWDGYHHTMFEMLGNWSFGDYFKKEAIEWSWELLTDVFKIPKDRLYVTVFEGDKKENLDFDQAAFDFWKLWIAEDRILMGNKKDNFWEMGAQGPCGPCSEIHVDLRPDSERSKTNGATLVNNDDPNVIEVWNNVFMQFNRKADGSLEPLPAQHVDTGMGFERLVRAVQGTSSNYATDVFLPLFSKIEAITGHKYTDSYEKTAKTDIAMRVVADHIRAVSCAIADGQLPESGGAGYVIRRILRRAVRYSYSNLGQKEPMLYCLVPILAEEFDGVFPELKAQVDFVTKVVLEEEKSFLRTLESGLKRFDNLDVSSKMIGGAAAFEMFDTYGFPIDLTRLIAAEKGFSVDEAGFEVALAAQKARSRADAVKEFGDWVDVFGDEKVEFVGYDQLEIRASKVIKHRTVVQKGKENYQIVLNRTPFYPEGGGQVGDTGMLDFEGEKIRVLDTKKENDLIIHLVEKLPRFINDPNVRGQVDVEKRKLTQANHSATHLLHAALRQVLGTHIAQKGSFLNEETLRFDISHFQKVTDEELREVEKMVNLKIRENIALDEKRDLPIVEAQKSGAMMLFGEKYGETVRMITFDSTYSRELCGGCHVKMTGEIGAFKITSESAVAAGVRRIEAVTAVGYEQFMAQKLERLAIYDAGFKNPKDVSKAVDDVFEQNKRQQKQIEQLVIEQARALRGALLAKKEVINDINLIAAIINIGDGNAVKTLAVEIAEQLGSAVVALGYVSNGKPNLAIKISDNLLKDRQLHAGNMVRELAKKMAGGGGGQPSFAVAGGSDLAGLDAAVAGVRDFLK
jgi:alanyl-tRNA synthetase